MALNPAAVRAMREELSSGAYDVLHIHEPVVPLLGWDSLRSSGELPLVGTFHTYSENALTNGIAAVPLGGRLRMNRLHHRIAVSQAAAWTAQALLRRPLHDHPERRAPSRARCAVPAPRQAESGPLRILFIGQAVERKGLPVLLRAFEALRDQVPATLTLVGAGAGEIDHMMLDGRGVHALGKVSEERKLAELGAGGRRLRAVAGRRELRHGPHRGLRGRRPRRRLRHPRLPRRARRTASRAGWSPPATRSRSPRR